MILSRSINWPRLMRCGKSWRQPGKPCPICYFELDADGRHLRVLSPKNEWLLQDPESLLGKTVVK